MSSPQPARPLAGILWMLLTGVCFVAVTALVKVVGDEMPAVQAAFLRYALGLVFLVPMIGALRRASLDRPALARFGWRGLVHAMGVMCWFYAMTRISIAEVTAMNYLSPVYVTIGAALLMGERLAWRRIGAIIAAFLGVLLILRPGFREVSAGHGAMILTALFFSGSYLLAKGLSGVYASAVVVAMLSLVVTVVLAPLALAVWVTPSPTALFWLFVVAGCATVGHLTMTQAFKAAPLGVTQPVVFVQIVWAALLGWLAFDEALDPWVIGGGGLIVASVSFIAWREAQLARRARAPKAAGAGPGGPGWD